jgi:hypothetical protein
MNVIYMYMYVYLALRNLGSNLESDMATISRPYENIKPKAVAYAAGIDKMVACRSVISNIIINPLLRGELVTARDTIPTGRELEIKTTATAVTSKVEIQNITLLGIFFLGSIISLVAKLRDSIPTKNHPANGKTFRNIVIPPLKYRESEPLVVAKVSRVAL